MKTYDAVVAGAGLIGGSIALELARAGLRVAVFDRQDPGREASRAAAGILSPAPESPSQIPMVTLGRTSLALYPEFVRSVEELSGQKVGYRPKGTLEALFSRDAARELSTLVALHRGLSLECEPLRVAEALELEPALSPDVAATALRPAEAAVDNRELTRAAIEAARRGGVEFCAGRSIEAIWREGNRCAGVVAAGKRIAAGWAIIAAGCFSTAIDGAAAYAPVRPARGQMVALRSERVKIERVLWSERVYLVPRNNGRIVAGSTVEYVGFEKGLTAGGIQGILDAAIEVAPGLKNAAIVETWSGLRPDTPDHLPIIGPTEIEGLVIATGHFRSGILLAPVTAKLIREWVTEKRVSLDWEMFSPMRFAEAEAQRRSGTGPEPASPQDRRAHPKL
ncbi:MAG: glycine oxidase ThiO [Candidatus Acidiferrales bacterium]|jgi:glycine oxidase